MKRMLFNATQSEELRVAIVDGQKLIDLDIEHAGKEQRKSNIYKGVITRIEPSLEAAFVDYGTDRHGFLPFKEIARSYFSDKPEQGRARIQDVIKEGQEVIVQVDKDERGTKGAALTTFISLAGRYLVLMPNNPRGGGVSRRVEGEERNELRDTMAQLEVPAGMSIIARTAGIGRTAEELQWDLNYLTQLWKAIEDASNFQPGAYLIYQEGSLVIRAIRDYYSADIGEILIDTPDVHEQAVQFMNHVMPGNVARVKLYQDEIPLFSRFQIEHQIETAFSREVRLPSGGAIVIDHTEALVSVDVNSGRSIKGADIEQTAFNTNLEAAEEVARQMRLRDLGGLVVIDFIDMENQRNQREVENTLRDALHHDRARVQMGKISRFGLLELSRQRLRPSLGETNHATCPRCNGTGHIRGIESTALHILRITQEEAMKENSAVIQVQLPVEAATFLLNEKRADIHKIEQRTGVEVLLIPNIHLETPNYNIVRIRHDDVNEETVQASYKMVDVPDESDYQLRMAQAAAPAKAEAVVKGITPATSAPIVEEKPAPVAVAAKKSLFSSLKAFFGLGEKPAEVASTPTKENREPGRDRNKNRQRRDRQRDRQQERNDKGARDTEAITTKGRDQRGTQDKTGNDKPGQDKFESNKPGQDKSSDKSVARQTHSSSITTTTDTVKTDVADRQPTSGQQNNDTRQERGERGNRRNRHGRRDRRPRDEGSGTDAHQGTVAPQATNANELTTRESTVLESISSDQAIATAAETISTAPIVSSETNGNAAQAQSEAPVLAAPTETQTSDNAASATPATSDKPARGRSRGGKGRKPNTAAENGIQLVETQASNDPVAVTSLPVEASIVDATPTKAKKPARKAKPAKTEVSDVAVVATESIQLVETKAEAVITEVTAPSPRQTQRRQPPKWKKTDASTDAVESGLVMVETQKDASLKH